MKQCIIYDCDGVIVDSELIAARIDSEFLTALGFEITQEECARLFIGNSANSIRDIILKKSGIHLTNVMFSELHKKILIAFTQELKPLMENILTTFQTNNLTQCLASSSKKAWITHALMVTNQLQFFNSHTIFSSDHVQNVKPHPDLFLVAAERLGYQPRECIVIEDSAAGIEAALAAKMNVIGFLGASHAQYDWYQERIKSYQIPIAYNNHELHELLRNHCFRF